ncbi:MAG: Imm50 family immunity protein [Candidatus Gracilibacteria bacterium]
MNTPIEINNAPAIVERFGFWPEFGDDEISEIHLDRAETSLSFTVDAIQYAEKNCQILFKCKSIKRLSIDGFNHQNVISKITFRQEDDGYLKILVASSFGVQIQCSCKTASVSILD